MHWRYNFSSTKATQVFGTLTCGMVIIKGYEFRPVRVGAGESGKRYLGPLKSGTPVELKTNITAVTGV